MGDDQSEDKPSEKPVPYRDFRALLEKTQEGKVAIFSHPCPDPDGLGSMMGIELLLRKSFGRESALFYSGEISHPQNGSMVNLLSVDLWRAEDFVPKNFVLRILVDAVPEHAGTGSHEVPFDVVVDHHREMPNGDFKGLFIHKKSGSCAAIVYDMMREIIVDNDWLDSQVDADTKVATGLITGIMTDTHFLLSDDCTEFDRNAFSELFEYRDAGVLHQVVFFKRRKFWIDRKAQAVAQAKIDDGGFAVVGLGLIPERERDLIADMADEMVNWASVETAIAFGVVGGERIEGSVRSLDASLNVSDFCKKLGGRHGSGGGKQGKGAYNLPLAGFSIDADEDDQDAEEAWESIRKRESKRILRTLHN